jgi:hypothetical protein
LRSGAREQLVKLLRGLGFTPAVTSCVFASLYEYESSQSVIDDMESFVASLPDEMQHVVRGPVMDAAKEAVKTNMKWVERDYDSVRTQLLSSDSAPLPLTSPRGGGKVLLLMFLFFFVFFYLYFFWYLFRIFLFVFFLIFVSYFLFVYNFVVFLQKASALPSSHEQRPASILLNIGESVFVIGIVMGAAYGLYYLAKERFGKHEWKSVQSWLKFRNILLFLRI